MAGSLNSVELIGNLGRDPEVRSFGNGGQVANFTIALDESYKKKDGEKVEKTEWVNISIMSDGLVGVVERYLKKGSKVYLRGQLQTRKWTDKDGTDRYTTEVVLRGPDAKMLMLDGASGGAKGEDRPARSAAPKGGGRQNVDLDDDIPF